MTASAISIILDPSEVSTGRTELDINSGSIRIADAGPDWGDAAIAAALADRKYGSVPVSYRIPNRVVTIPLIVRADDLTFNQAQTKLQQKVARFQDEGGWLKRVSSDGTTKLYADVVNASLTFPDPRFQDVEGGVILTLECLPDFYGTQATGKTTTASSGDHDSLIFTETDIPGDYPARSRYTFTDTGSQVRQAVIIASQSRTYSSANTAQLSYEAEALTPLDTAAIVTKTGAHGGATNNAVAHTGIGSWWTPIVSTKHATYGNATHVGTYRMFARVYATAESLVRLEYAVGDGTMRRTNEAVTVLGSGTFYLVDLGEVRIPIGSDLWVGAVFAQSETTGTTVGVDKLWLAPTESLTIVKGRRSVTSNVETGLSGWTGRDAFTSNAAALNAAAADVGGNWATSGDADDFSKTGGQAVRTAVSDSGLESGRRAVLGSNVTNFGAYIAFSVTSDTPVGVSGLLGRYVDANNWMAAGIYRDGAGTGYSYVFRVIAGVKTDIHYGATKDIQVGVGYSLQLQIAASGHWILHHNGVYEAAGYDSTFATGGTLASGKTGFYDAQTGSGANTRAYDTFRSWAPDTDAACLSGCDLIVSHDGAERERAEADNLYVPAFVEGSYPRAPASGLESRTCRTLILPSAGDIDTIPDADPLAFSVASAHSPCFLFVPEE